MKWENSMYNIMTTAAVLHRCGRKKNTFHTCESDKIGPSIVFVGTSPIIFSVAITTYNYYYIIFYDDDDNPARKTATPDFDFRIPLLPFHLWEEKKKEIAGK